MKMVCGERFLVLMLGNTVEERLVNSFTNAGTSGWSALISWRHHRELRWTQLYGLPVSPCMMIMKLMNTFITKSYFSLEQSLTHTHTHTDKHTSFRAHFPTQHLTSSNPSKRFSLLLRRWRKISSSLATPTLLFAALADFFGMAKQQRRAADKTRFEGARKGVVYEFHHSVFQFKGGNWCFSRCLILISIRSVPYCMHWY